MDKKIVDVEYTEVNKQSLENYYTIDYVAKQLNVDESKIVFWCNKFNDLLNIQTISMYHVFNNIDVENLKTIKRKNIDEGLSIKEIKEYLNKNNDAIIIPKRNNNEISLINIFSEIINLQNKKLDKIIDNQNKILEIGNEIQSNITSKVDEKISEVVTDKLDEQSQILESKIQHITDENEKQFTDKWLKIEEEYKQLSQNRKKQYEEEQENKRNKGFWNKISNMFNTTKDK